jgi:hypothetical protein
MSYKNDTIQSKDSLRWWVIGKSMADVPAMSSPRKHGLYSDWKISNHATPTDGH